MAINKSFSVVLDLSRWVAAFLVVIGHARHIALVDYREAVDKGIGLNAFYFLTGFGHEAVVIFFVLSGFLVGGVTLRKWKSSGVNFADYFAHRFSRIYVVLIPAIFVTLALDYAGYTYFNGAELYTNSAKYHTNILQVVLHRDFDAWTFVGNVLMLENMEVPIQGSLLTVWSLVYEWWYYCLFAAFAGMLLCQKAKQRVLAGVAFFGMFIFLPWDLLAWGAIWVLGVAVFAYCESSLLKPNIWLSLALFLAAMIGSRISTHNMAAGPMPQSFLKDFVIGIGYALVLASFYGRSVKIPLETIHRKLAGFSYSLYLVHFPMMVFAVAALHDTFGIQFQSQPNTGGICYFAVLVAALCGYAFGFSTLTENHTQWVRTAILRMGKQAQTTGLCEVQNIPQS